MAKLGENLAKIRKKYDLTMQEIADTLDTSTSTVNKLEKDKKITFFIKYLYFCKNKGEDLNKIFDDDGYKDFIKDLKKKKK